MIQFDAQIFELGWTHQLGNFRNSSTTLILMQSGSNHPADRDLKNRQIAANQGVQHLVHVNAAC